MSKRPRILAPEAVPVAGTDAHLPAVPADVLTEAALRRRFALGEPALRWTPSITGDGSPFIPEKPPSPAAVLVPLVSRSDGLHVLLTQRTAHLRDHAGQISFPGGRSEPDDAGPIGTALREAEEEVGLPRECVDVIGELPHYTTVTSYVVTPVVAVVRPPFDLTLDPFEVAEAFEVPLQFLMTPAHHQRRVFDYDGGRRQFLSMPWRPPGEPSREFFIWGATAAMLRNLYHFLAETDA